MDSMSSDQLREIGAAAARRLFAARNYRIMQAILGEPDMNKPSVTLDSGLTISVGDRINWTERNGQPLWGTVRALCHTHAEVLIGGRYYFPAYSSIVTKVTTSEEIATEPKPFPLQIADRVWFTIRTDGVFVGKVFGAVATIDRFHRTLGIDCQGDVFVVSFDDVFARVVRNGEISLIVPVVL